MTTDLARPRRAPQPGRRRSLLPVAALLLALAMVIAAACSGEDPSLESTDEATPTSSDGAVAAADAPDTETAPAAPPRSDAAEEGTAGETVVIGVLLDTSNLMATTDRQPGVAFVDAIERIGAEEGIDGRLVDVRWVNTTSRMSVIDAEAADLIDAGADLLVVTCELDFARPAVDRGAEAGVLVVSPCGPEQAWGSGELGPTVFSMMPSVEALGEVMADHVWAEGHRRVGVVVDDTAPEPRAECRGFRERWRELGGRIAADFAVNLTTAQALARDADQLDDLRADALVLCSFARVAGAVVESVRGQAVQVPIIAGPSLDSGVWVPDDVDAPLRDFTMLTLASTSGDDPVDAVVASGAEFLIADGVPPNSGRFVLGADLAEAYRIAVTRAGTTDAGPVADALRALVDEPLVSGPVTFGGAQAPETWALRVMRHESGAFVNDGVVAVATAQ